MNTRRVSAGCGVVAALLLIAGAVLWFSNPSVDVSATDYGSGGRPAGRVECSVAPWDAGMNDDRSGPGGETRRPYYEEVATECYAANLVRYHAAIASGVLALVAPGAGVVAALRSRRPVGVAGRARARTL